jgi:hypothetical protein
MPASRTPRTFLLPALPDRKPLVPSRMPIVPFLLDVAGPYSLLTPLEPRPAFRSRGGMAPRNPRCALG